MKPQHYCLEGILHNNTCNCRCAPCRRHILDIKNDKINQDRQNRQDELKKELERDMAINPARTDKRNYIAPYCNSRDPNCECYVCSGKSLQVVSIVNRK